MPQLRDTAEVLAAAASACRTSWRRCWCPASGEAGRRSEAGAQAARVRALGLGGAQPQQRPAPPAGVGRRSTSACSPPSRPRWRSASTSPRPSTARSPGACRRRRRWRCSTGWCRCARTPRSACATRPGRADPDHVEGLVAACRARFPEVGRLGDPPARHLRARAGQRPRRLPAGRARVRRFLRRPRRLPVRPGCYRQRRHRGRGLDVRADGGATGIDLDAFIPVAREAAALPGGQAGGRVRDALASRCAAVPATAAT